MRSSRTEITFVSPTEATGIWSMEDKIKWPDGRTLHGYGHYHERYRKVADAAAAAVRADQWTMATASCHGVVENVEFLLDMAEATGDCRHRDWAMKTVERLIWPDDAGLPVLVGALVRLVAPGVQRLWMPPLRPTAQ